MQTAYGMCYQVSHYLRYPLSGQTSTIKHVQKILRVMTSTSHCFSLLAHRMRSFSSISRVPASLNTRNGVLSWMYLACCSTKATRGTRKTISLSLECSRAEIHLMRSNPMSVFPDPVLRAAITFSTFKIPVHIGSRYSNARSTFLSTFKNLLLVLAWPEVAGVGFRVGSRHQ